MYDKYNLSCTALGVISEIKYLLIKISFGICKIVKTGRYICQSNNMIL